MYPEKAKRWQLSKLVKVLRLYTRTPQPDGHYSETGERRINTPGECPKVAIAHEGLETRRKL